MLFSKTAHVFDSENCGGNYLLGKGLKPKFIIPSSRVTEETCGELHSISLILCGMTQWLGHCVQVIQRLLDLEPSTSNVIRLGSFGCFLDLCDEGSSIVFILS